MDTQIAFTLSIISIISAGVSIGIAWGVLKTQVKAHTTCLSDLESRLRKVEADTNRIETKTELFWNAVAEKVANMLHSPHAPRRDELLEKMQKERLSLDEAYELKTLLDMDSQEFTGAKILAYALVTARLQVLMDVPEHTPEPAPMPNNGMEKKPCL